MTAPSPLPAPGRAGSPVQSARPGAPPRGSRAGDAFAALVTAAVRDALAGVRPDDGRCLTVADCAERLAVSRDTVDALIRRGELPSLRVGRSVRVRLVDLLAYQEAQLVDGAA